MKESFAVLPKKYPQIKLVDNNDYLEKNNISSIYAAKDVLGTADCFICEADLLISESSIFMKNLHNLPLFHGLHPQPQFLQIRIHHFIPEQIGTFLLPIGFHDFIPKDQAVRLRNWNRFSDMLFVYIYADDFWACRNLFCKCGGV